MTNLNEMFPHIAGYTKIKEEGAQIVDILTNSKYYLEKGAHIPRGWFFYGEPGMGKTRLVKDIAEYISFPIVEISSSSAIKKNETIEQNIVNGFKEAIDKMKAIIFIDELDKIAGYRRYSYEIEDNLKLQKIFLHELDEVKEYDEIVVVATANRPEYLNDTILRSGRFDRMLMFPYPNPDDREQIIKLFLGDYKLANDIDFKELVKMTAYSSCAEIESMVNEAKLKTITQREDCIKSEYFVNALTRIRFRDIPREEIKDLTQSRYIAYHECGHALVSYLLKPELIHNVSIVPQGESAGALKIYGDDDVVKTKTYREIRAKIALGGFSAVKVMTGEMTSGNCSDIKSAIKEIKRMCEDGMYGLEYVDIFDPERDEFNNNITSDAHKDKKCNFIQSTLEGFNKEVISLIENNKDKIEKLANELMNKKNLSRKEIIGILDNAN